MKRFFQTILIVLGLLIAASMPFDYAFSNYLLHSKARKYVVWNEIIQDSVGADLLVLGSSRAWVHYDTYIMDSILNTNSYNLGIDGSALNRQMLRYRIYDHYQKRKAKVILVNIDCLSVDCTVGYEREQFFPYFHIEYAGKEMKEMEPFSVAELYLPMYRYKHGVYSTIMDNKGDMTLYKGYWGQDRQWNGTEFSKIKTYHFIGNESVEKAFDSFLCQLIKQNIRVVFVVAPIYIGLTNKIDSLPEFYKIFQSYSDKYAIPIMDYTYYH